MMKIALIGTYQPRQCGIGHFSKNLIDAVLQHPDQEIEAFVVAINDPGGAYNYPEEVKFTIDQNDHEAYLKAAEFINQQGADLCIVQHEYGIFGGQHGVYILSLMHRLTMPILTTLHTVLKKPAYNELHILKEIATRSQKVVVMADKAVELLKEVYGINKERIAVIPHGVPDIGFERKAVRKALNVADRKLLVTFGFIGRNKGIETVISALPNVVAEHPEVQYVVLGRTHPNVIRHAGEEYRLFLRELVANLGLEDHVVFINEHASQDVVFKYLCAADIYITPYLHEAQITSGTLSYALGVGAAVVSTPYWHAAELLADGRGALFGFGDTDGLTRLLQELFSNPKKLEAMRYEAQAYGDTIKWPKIGGRYAALCRQELGTATMSRLQKGRLADRPDLPPLRLDHALRLTDSTGILQHATYGIPNYREGYCLDDNARALLMALMACRGSKDKTVLRLIPTYLAYIHYAQNDDGTFRNFMGFDRRFLEEVGSEDAFGRAIWAIGYATAYAPNDAFFQVARMVLFKAVPQFGRLRSIRAIANTILGLYHYLKSHPTDEGMIELARQLAQRLYDEYRAHRHDDWKWYETLMAYDNAILPLAMLHAAELIGNDDFRNVGFESMYFLKKHTMQRGYLSLVGNEGWFKRDGDAARFDQQPLDAMATVLLFAQAFHLTADTRHRQSAYAAFRWFLGENDLRMSLYDVETYGCCDGLRPDGVNRNQGAESTLAYLISHLTIQQLFAKSANRTQEINAHENSPVGANSVAYAAS